MTSPRLLCGVQGLYDEASDRIVESPVRLTMDLQPFSSGGMRDSYAARVLTDDGKEVRAVVKRIRPGLGLEPHETCLREVNTQNLARRCATAFNALCRRQGLAECQVEFLPVALLRLEGVAETMTLEPYLEGRYVKHSDNLGHDLGASELPAAFSWFTFVASGGSLVVCDLQGVGARFTDPQIHSSRPELRLGAGNLGRAGLELFERGHRQNSIVERLGLPQKSDASITGAQLCGLAAQAHPAPQLRGGLLHGFAA